MIFALNRNWKKEEIAIKDLSLWDENPRFPEEYFNKTEDELIAYFLKKKEFNVESFSKEVVKEFDLPQLERIVVLKLDSKLIVLEGNRRLLVYKLLIDPFLAKEQRLHKLFKELHNRISITNSFKLEANITSLKDEGLRFVDRKHNKGNNEVGWGEPERRKFSVMRSGGKHSDIRRIELAGAVKKLDMPDEIKDSILGKGYVTTLYRVIDSAPAQKKLGYDVSESGHIKIKNQAVFDDILKVIAFNIWNKKGFDGSNVDSRSLNKGDSIADYIKQLKQKDVSKVDNQIKAQTDIDLLGAKTLTKGIGRSKPPSGSRQYLINSSIYIKDSRSNDIYNELRKKLKVHEVPNAVAVLFRVFLECSVDCYIKDNTLPIADGMRLSGKINEVANHLKKKGLADDQALKNVRRLAQKDNHNILSVTTLHDFIHDYKTSPVSVDLINYWNNLDGFFIILWKSLMPVKK